MYYKNPQFFSSYLKVKIVHGNKTTKQLMLMFFMVK